MAGGRPRSTSLPYVPIDPHIAAHARTEALVDALAEHTELPDSLIVAIPIRIFLYAGRQAIDGVIGQMSPRALVRLFAPEFGFDPEVLYRALTDPALGFFVRSEDGELSIHDWQDGGGRVFQERERWRAKEGKKRVRANARRKAAVELGQTSEPGQANKNPSEPSYLGVIPEISPRYPGDLSEISRYEGEVKGKDLTHTHIATTSEPLEGDALRKTLVAIGVCVSGSVPRCPQLAALRPTRDELEAAASSWSPGKAVDYLAPIVRALRQGNGKATPGRDRPPAREPRRPSPTVEAIPYGELCRAWSEASALAGLSVPSDERLRRLAALGPPGARDVDALRVAGSWAAWDSRQRDAAREAMRAVLTPRAEANAGAE